MSTQRERVAAYRDALTGVGATEIRMPTSTPDAIKLAQELTPDELRFPAVIAAAFELWNAIPPAPAPGDFDAQLAHGKLVDKACTAFWDGFEGQPVDGVEIIRRR